MRIKSRLRIIAHNSLLKIMSTWRSLTVPAARKVASKTQMQVALAKKLKSLSLRCSKRAASKHRASQQMSIMQSLSLPTRLAERIRKISRIWICQDLSSLKSLRTSVLVRTLSLRGESLLIILQLRNLNERQSASKRAIMLKTRRDRIASPLTIQLLILRSSLLRMQRKVLIASILSMSCDSKSPCLSSTTSLEACRTSYRLLIKSTLIKECSMKSRLARKTTRSHCSSRNFSCLSNR